MPGTYELIVFVSDVEWSNSEFAFQRGKWDLVGEAAATDPMKAVVFFFDAFEFDVVVQEYGFPLSRHYKRRVLVFGENFVAFFFDANRFIVKRFSTTQTG